MKRFKTYLNIQEASVPPAGTIFTSWSNNKINDDITLGMGGLPGFGVKKSAPTKGGKVKNPEIYGVGQDPEKIKYYACQGKMAEEDPTLVLKTLEYKVIPSDEVFSKGTTTWIVVKQFGDQWLGTHFINKFDAKNSLETKWLTPAKMGVATGQPLNVKKIVQLVTAKIDNHPSLTDKVKKKLKNTLKLVQDKGQNYFKGGKSQAKLPKKHKTYVINIAPLGLTDRELTTISKDFGEILSAVWAIRNIGFTHVIFPSDENTDLLDFLGVARQGKIQYPVSVKSGGGASTTMKNLTEPILRLLQDPSFKETFTKRELKIVKNYLELIIKGDVMDGIIKIHQQLKTPAIAELETATDLKGNKMSAQTLTGWLGRGGPDEKNADEVQSKLAGFYKENGSAPEPASWTKYNKDKLERPVGVIVGPLGMALIGVMNANEEIRTTLTKCARSIILLQMNVDVKTKKMSFRRGKFKDFSFHFSWGGSTTNPHKNKFGFKAETFK